MPSSSAPCLLKFPIDLLLPVEPGVLQRDRNTFGALLFNMFECAHFPSLIKIDWRSEGALLKLNQAMQTLSHELMLLKEQSAEISCLRRNGAEKLIASTVKNIVKPLSWFFTHWKCLSKENEQSRQRKWRTLFNAGLHKFQLIFQEMAGRNFTSFCLFNYSLEIFLVWLNSRILLLH